MMFTTLFQNGPLARLIQRREQDRGPRPDLRPDPQGVARFGAIDDTLDRLQTEVPGLLPAHGAAALDLAQAPFDEVASEMKSQGFAWLLPPACVMQSHLGECVVPGPRGSDTEAQQEDT